MANHDLAKILQKELGYADSPEFQDSVSWPNRRPVPHVESAYLVQNVPVAYFARLSDADPLQLWKLHHSVWNYSRVPLLYVVLPQEIRVYNGYARPAEQAEDLDQEGRLLERLDQLVEVETARQQIHERLEFYDRLHLETGAFWSTPGGQRIHRENRADQSLLRAMDRLRVRLLATGLTEDLAYGLLGRSIFIRYLEDRQILTSEAISSLTNGAVGSYYAALSDQATTYLLFERLARRFNGDLFPVLAGEIDAVNQEHLRLLALFLSGGDVDTGQLGFWPYDFCYIPIELVSGIYDTFLQKQDRRESGMYYTPLALADFVLDQSMPAEASPAGMTVFDPACGSGVFLVRAYQRLVTVWERENGRPAGVAELADILQHRIFGIDENPSAVRIAAFNLYLALLDRLDGADVQNLGFRFPPLQGSNLVAADFFSPAVQKQFGGRRFDRVIGNPPWGKGTLAAKSAAAGCMDSLGFTVGNKQLVQAFLAVAPEFCAPGGEVAFLAPAKSTILVTSTPHQSFRQQFFEHYDVHSVVNFAALRHELFGESLSPAVALFYRPQVPSPGRRITYGVPKPSLVSRQLGAIVLDATEVKYLERQELLAQPWLWKVALWGTPRDAALIEQLRSLPSLEQQIKQLDLGWEIHEGIQLGGSDKYYAPWLEGKLLLLTRGFRRYALHPESFESIQGDVFHRPCDPSVFRGPLALIHHSPIDGRCAAAFSANDVVYRHKISGVAGKLGQEPLLKWLVAYINSPIAQYYQFLTSTSWAVERDTIIQEEYLQMPFPIPDEDDPCLERIINHFDHIVALLQGGLETQDFAIQTHETAIAEAIFELLDLTTTERQLVQDTIDYRIPYFLWSTRKRRRVGEVAAIQSPDAAMLLAYTSTFAETATALLRYQGQTLNACMYQDGAPLSVVAFQLVNRTQARPTEVIASPQALRNLLHSLDCLLLERRTQALYMRRHVRIYDQDMLYLVRPSERRFWTCSQARADADEVLLEWLGRGRDGQE